MVLLTTFRAGFLLLHLHVKLHLLYKVMVFADSSAFRIPSWCYKRAILSFIPLLMHRWLWTRIILHNYQPPACCQKANIYCHIYIFCSTCIELCLFSVMSALCKLMDAEVLARSKIRISFLINVMDHMPFLRTC